MKGFRQKVNLLKFLLGYNLRRTRLNYPPFFIWVEPTNRCNLRCSICSRGEGGRETGFMELELFREIVSQLRELNPLVITLHLAGEPLLHPRLPEMIRLATDNGIGTTLSTNGMLLSEGLAQELIEAGLLSLRVDFSPNKGKFESARSGSDWSQVRENINFLLALKKKRGLYFPVVKIQNIRFSEGEEPERQEMQDLKALFSDNPADEYFHFQTHSWGGKFAEKQRENPTYKLSIKRAKYHPCTHLWNSFVITYEGHVVPCCRDLNAELVLGDIRNQKVLQVWRSEEYENLRRLHVNKKIAEIDLCRHCSKPYEASRLLYYLFRYIYIKVDDTLRRGKTRRS